MRLPLVIRPTATIVQAIPPERWLSGRRRCTRNALYPMGTQGSNPCLSAILLDARSATRRNGRFVFGDWRPEGGGCDFGTSGHRALAPPLCAPAALPLRGSAALRLCRSAPLPLCRSAALWLCASAALRLCGSAAPCLCRSVPLPFCGSAALTSALMTGRRGRAGRGRRRPCR